MTDAEVSRLLSELKESAQELNSASDSINLIISSIEQKILESNVGLECWLLSEPLNSGEPTRQQINDRGDWGSAWTDTVLGFAKLDAHEGWRLAVREIGFTAVEDAEAVADYEQPSPLWRASRELRIRALEKMPALLQCLRDKVKKSLDAIAKAKKMVQ
jgi:hypothetical protein